MRMNRACICERAFIRGSLARTQSGRPSPDKRTAHEYASEPVDPADRRLDEFRGRRDGAGDAADLRSGGAGKPADAAAATDRAARHAGLERRGLEHAEGPRARLSREI